MLVGGMLLGMGEIAPLQVPNLKTAAAADQGDFAFQLQLFAKVVRQDEPTLFVGSPVLGLRMELAQINPAIGWRNIWEVLGRGAEALEFGRWHDKQKLTARFGHHEKFFTCAGAPPGSGDGDAVFVVELMAKLSRVKN